MLLSIARCDEEGKSISATIDLNHSLDDLVARICLKLIVAGIRALIGGGMGSRLTSINVAKYYEIVKL